MTAWIKSSFCNGASTCVETAFVEGHVVVRDSKFPGRAVLVFTLREWEVFTKGVRAGEFDVEALRASVGDGSDVNGSPRVSSAPVARVEPSQVSP